MELKKIKEVLRHRPDDMIDQLYHYGYGCGRNSVINFEIIQQVFYNYNYNEKERLHYMRKILKGFMDGCRGL